MARSRGAANRRQQKSPQGQIRRAPPPPPDGPTGIPTPFDAECGVKVLTYESDTPHAVRARVMNSKNSRCTVALRLFKRDDAGMLSGPAKDVVPATEEILERRQISVIEIQCGASSGGVGGCQGRYVIEFLD